MKMIAHRADHFAAELYAKCKAHEQMKGRKMFKLVHSQKCCVAIAALAFSSIGIATASETEAPVLPDGLQKVGDSKSCLPIRRIRSIRALDELNLLVTVRGGERYLNQVNTRCNAADRSYARLNYKLPNGQLCQNDIINVVDATTGVPIGSCGLNEFQTLEKSPDQDQAD